MPWFALELLGRGCLSILFLVVALLSIFFEWNGGDHDERVVKHCLYIGQITHLSTHLTLESYELIIDQLDDTLVPDLILIPSVQLSQYRWLSSRDSHIEGR